MADLSRVAIRSPKQRWRLPITEFLLTPLAMVLGFVALAAVATLVDFWSTAWPEHVRDWLARLFPHENLLRMLGVIATGLVTVTTLTLSALLVAISHTSTTVAPVVFDQFLRRKANQAYFGYVAGCATYTYLVMAVARPTWAGVGPLLAIALAAGALVLLIFMAYLMIDQMRPTTVVRSIQDRAGQARERQYPLLARCRPVAEVRDDRPETVTTESSGYVVDIVAARLEALMARVGDGVEVAFQVRIGDLLAYGDGVVRIRGGSPEQRRIAAAGVLDCVIIDRTRDAGIDPDYAIDQLGNIAWAATSSRQNPDVAQAAVGALRDLSGRWAATTLPAAEEYGGRLPVVYDDAVQRKIVATLVDIVVVSTSSRQHHTCATALASLAEILPQLQEHDREVAVRSLVRALPAALAHVASVELSRALAKLRAALDAVGHEDLADQVRAMGPLLVDKGGLVDEQDLIDQFDDPDLTGPRPFRFR
ncbi:DUF2254 family protein [Nonomuraea soli]|uniref:Putative membrane protein n=1 Tax=Nonomuraea soli TaxID=1032476 RepID=A0A7W0CNW7_9ACTN|nr:DUF2254 family protein [Nonomuraea soli]MBA2894512.1 putative membrane protein [Nonomuraea soli]